MQSSGLMPMHVQETPRKHGLASISSCAARCNNVTCFSG